jgi:translation initiation factor IF-1
MEQIIPMSDATIHAVGKVLENLNPILYRVALPNGKAILAHLSKPLTEAKTVFSINERIVLELTAYDFDQARILGLAD